MPKLPGAGRKAIAITPEVLARVESAGDSALTMTQAAALVGMSLTTLSRKLTEFAELNEAWLRGKAKRSARLLDAAKLIEAGLITNAITPIKGQPGGNIAAQAIFYDKVIGKEVVNAEADSQSEIREVIFRQTTPTRRSQARDADD